MKKALVIDDKKEVTRMAQLCLESYGFEVTVCDSLEAALVTLRSETFDFILTDYNIPSGDEGEMIVKMARLLQPMAFIVLWSGRMDKEVSEKCRGANLRLSKPTTFQHLMSSMATHLARMEAEPMLLM